MSVYVIAEIGINHGGEMFLAQELIAAAKDCGADAVKFQLYDPHKIFPDDKKLLEEALKCQLSQAQWFSIAEYAQKVGIECSASVFDTERLEWLKSTNPPWYKVASRSFYEVKLVHAMLSEKKPVYMSLGKVFPPPEGFSAVSVMEAYRNADAKFLYCKSEYPAKLDKDELQQWYSMPYGECLFGEHFVGYSDHTEGIGAALWAIAHGATVIEKHFTLDKTMKGSDHACSAEPGELKLLCDLAPGIQRIASL